MPAGNDFNNQQQKQQAQWLSMRGAQMAQEKAGQQTELGAQPKAHGSKRQLAGTVIAIAAVLIVLAVLAAWGII